MQNLLRVQGRYDAINKLAGRHGAGSDLRAELLKNRAMLSPVLKALKYIGHSTEGTKTHPYRRLCYTDQGRPQKERYRVDIDFYPPMWGEKRL